MITETQDCELIGKLELKINDNKTRSKNKNKNTLRRSENNIPKILNNREQWIKIMMAKKRVKSEQKAQY